MKLFQRTTIEYSVSYKFIKNIGDYFMTDIILTGDRPTGRLHLGHLVGSLSQRVALQNSGKYEHIYIEIADAQATTDNSGNIQKVKDNVIEVALDYLSCGLDPSKSTIFLQSEVPETEEKSYCQAGNQLERF